MSAAIDLSLRELYAEFGRGDLGAVLSRCDDAIVFEVPGVSPLAGLYRKQTFGELVERVMRLSGGTFQEDLLDVLVGERYAAVYLTHRLARDGTESRYQTIHLWEHDGEVLTGWREYPADLRAFDEAWSEPAGSLDVRTGLRENSASWRPLA
ncbi:MAG: hypothetical protein U0821_23765 [Chloroflexota bacterium]